jgi:DNA polymerase-4
MDAFYASIEQRDDPELRGKPVIVGGSGPRGVVAAASYEARGFGVHSAMPGVRAKALCPDGVFVRPRMKQYQSVSADIFEIFRSFTPLVEGLSLDEAFLDVTACRRLHGTAPEIGHKIRATIKRETRLVASVGVAPNKFLAKLASDYRKPDGLWQIHSGHIQEFLDPLPVRRIWGIGKRAGGKLEKLGINTIADLRSASPSRLAPVLGGQLEHFLALARGEDEREVVPFREDKSISHEETLAEDLTDLRECQRLLLELSSLVGPRLRKKALRALTVTVKIRTRAFKTYTRSHTVGSAIDDDRSLYQQARQLLDQWWSELGPAEIRLLGVGVSNFSGDQQQSLFDGPSQPSRIDQVSDRVRSKYGSASIKPAALVKPDQSDSE